MVFGGNKIERKITAEGKEIKNVERFTHLGSTVTYDLDCKKKISVWIAKAVASLTALEKLRKSKSVSLQIKLPLLKTNILEACCMHVWNTDIDKVIQKKDSGIQKKMLHKDYANRMVSESNDQGTLHKGPAKNNSTPESDTEKATTVWTYVQKEWQSNGEIAVFGITDGKNKVGRPYRKWVDVDDIKDWSRVSLQEPLCTRQNQTEQK